MASFFHGIDSFFFYKLRGALHQLRVKDPERDLFEIIPAMMVQHRLDPDVLLGKALEPRENEQEEVQSIRKASEHEVGHQ